MRARYSAYARGDIDFIVDSQAPETRGDTDRNLTEQWSRQAEWQGLDVRKTTGGGAGDAEGIVEFVARYRLKDQDVAHHELATFRKDDGVWYFVDGAPPKQEPFKREKPKVGPNEPCPCGSGKKSKKCCGRA